MARVGLKKRKKKKRIVITGKLMQSLEARETSQLAVLSNIIYLQLTPVMRKVLTMSTGGKGKKEDESEQNGSRLVRGWCGGGGG